MQDGEGSIESTIEKKTKTSVAKRSKAHSFSSRSNGITLSHLVVVVFELAE